MSIDNATENNAVKTITQQLDELFAPWNRTDAPGLIVGVMGDGVSIYRRGFGMASLETSVANTPATRMRIASISKHFTALLALLLAEEGKLDIDATIRTYIPELVGPGGDPTLRQLLQHRGGSRCYLNIGFISHGMTLAPLGTALATQVRQTGRNFAPGEAMIYNNGGYHLVSIAIERAGGTPFEAQLKQRLFDAVGMPDTESLPSDYRIAPGIATMHVPLPDGTWRRGLFPSEETKGEGAIVSTVEDMLRWAAHLRTQDKFGSRATWSALIEPPRFPDGTIGHYALGLMSQSYRGLATLRHSGGVIGGSSELLTFPNHGLDIVILANGAQAAAPPILAEKIADIVLGKTLGERKPVIAASDYKILLGDWWSPETGMIYSILDDHGTLKMTIFGMPARSATPLERRGDQGLVLFSDSMGPVRVDTENLNADEVTIWFGGRASAYRKVTQGTMDVTTFAQAAVGSYYAHDADCTATVALDGKALTIRFADSQGCVNRNLVCLGETVASTLMDKSEQYLLTFERHGTRMASFRCNTPRTRDLKFERLTI